VGFPPITRPYAGGFWIPFPSFSVTWVATVWPAVAGAATPRSRGQAPRGEYHPAVSEPDLDVIVFGATGVTGHRVAAYFSEQSAQTGARWAAAARDARKLERILAEDGVSGAETIVADLGDSASLARMASRTKVVLNLVGPYTLYARRVIEACITGGAHYLDLSGEIPFVRQVTRT
jgi:short subunit dehydrogenase-like uncharacterized protein